MEYKARIKFECEHGIDSGEIYKLMVDLFNRTPVPIYIEMEDENGEVIGTGTAGEDAN